MKTGSIVPQKPAPSITTAAPLLPSIAQNEPLRFHPEEMTETERAAYEETVRFVDANLPHIQRLLDESPLGRRFRDPKAEKAEAEQLAAKRVEDAARMRNRTSEALAPDMEARGMAPMNRVTGAGGAIEADLSRMKNGAAFDRVGHAACVTETAFEIARRVDALTGSEVGDV